MDKDIAILVKKFEEEGKERKEIQNLIEIYKVIKKELRSLIARKGLLSEPLLGYKVSYDDTLYFEYLKEKGCYDPKSDEIEYKTPFNIPTDFLDLFNRAHLTLAREKREEWKRLIDEAREV